VPVIRERNRHNGLEVEVVSKSRFVRGLALEEGEVVLEYDAPYGRNGVCELCADFGEGFAALGLLSAGRALGVRARKSRKANKQPYENIKNLAHKDSPL